MPEKQTVPRGTFAICAHVGPTGDVSRGTPSARDEQDQSDAKQFNHFKSMAAACSGLFCTHKKQAL